jgi:tight adherence protein C
VDTPLLVAMATFTVILLASTAAFLYLNSREQVQTWRRRVEGSSAGVDEETTSVGVFDQLREELVRVLEWLGRLNQPSAEDVRSTRLLLINAGYRSGKAPLLFLGAKLMLAVLLVFLFTLVPAKLMGFPSASSLTMYYVMTAAVGYYLPVIWLRRVIASRKDALQRAMPDALDLMVVCVEAGLGLDQAIGRVSQEVNRTHPALGDELGVLTVELRTGISRQEALKNLARRSDLEELGNLVAMLVQTDRFGTSIGQALRVYADSMRTTRRLKAEELAAKLPVKLLLPLIFFIFPSLIVVTVGPAAIRMARVLLPAMGGH